MISQEKIDTLLKIECADNVKNLIKEAIKGWEKSEPTKGGFGIKKNHGNIWILNDYKQTCLIGASMVNKPSESEKINKFLDNQFLDAEKYFDLSFDEIIGLSDGFDDSEGRHFLNFELYKKGILIGAEIRKIIFG